MTIRISMQCSCRISNPYRLGAILSVLIGVLVVGGCATPVGVRRLDPKSVQRSLTASILSGDRLSAPTRQILNRAGLFERFQSRPQEVLTELHGGLPTASQADRLFALAELSYAYASEGGPKPYYLASAVYAYAFLFPQRGREDPIPSDPRVRTAFDLYNRSVAEACTVEGRSHVEFKGGAYRLPFGVMEIRINENEFMWGPFRLVGFVQAAELDVRGLRNRYRWPGIGAPLAAALKPIEGMKVPAYSRIPPNLKVPITAFLRIENAEKGLETGKINANLELYDTVGTTTVHIGGRSVPVEYEVSSIMAYTLEGSRAYEFELKGLFSGDFSLIKETARHKDGIFLLAPYRPGLIPVVFVHGTASSPARWAEMLNELSNDPDLASRYQFWVFTYNTGNPIAYSAGILAEALRKTIEELDPAGNDPALKLMVVIGHSQGGLLAKLMVVDSGNKLWDHAFTVPLEDLKLSPENKVMLKRSLFFKPIPAAKKVVFLATPHQGSFIAGGWIGRLVRKFISLPFLITETVKDVVTLNPELGLKLSMKDIPRSTDTMDPKSPFIKTVSSLPIVPGVTVHSIIAVKNPDSPQDKWTDGVVNYGSAHIDGVASEKIIHSGHSTQDNPETIEEVRRILGEYVRQLENEKK